MSHRSTPFQALLTVVLAITLPLCCYNFHGPVLSHLSCNSLDEAALTLVAARSQSDIERSLIEGERPSGVYGFCSDAGTIPVTVVLTSDETALKTIDVYTISLGLVCEGNGPVKTDAETHLVFTINKDGEPVRTLAPYLGAMGHLVVISANRAKFVHSHPHETGTAGLGGTTVEFEAHFRKPGMFKA